MSNFEPPEDKELALEEHLVELRRRLLIIIISIFLSSAIIFPFSKKILLLIQEGVVPSGTKIIVLNPMEYLYMLILLSITLAFVVNLPLVVYETFMFIKPGLFPSERRFFLRVVPTSLLLFFIGMIFSYKLLIPLSMEFLISYAQGKAEPMLVLSRFIRFLTFMLISIGLIFQIPLVVSFLVKGDLIKKEDLKKKRKLIYGVLIFLALTVAPDPTPVTPLLILLTLAIVYEASILFADKLL